MTVFIPKLREISVFIITFIFLLIFNLYFNFNYSWYGVSVIVRAYLFVLSFYLIFIFASIEINQLKKEYADKYGRKGIFLLFAETRILPFLLIYIFTIIFTLIDYIRVQDWPWNPLLSLLNGRYSNTVIYSWLLLIVLSLKKKLSIRILLFLSILFIYGILDKVIYSVIDTGIAITGIKLIKIILFLFFLINEFFNNIRNSAILSVVLSIFIFFSTVSCFSVFFKQSEEKSFQKKEAGLIFLRMGFTFPLEKLKNLAVKTSDKGLLKEVLFFSSRYSIDVKYSREEWEDMLLSGSVESADTISSYLIRNNIDVSFEKILSYADTVSETELNNLDKAENFIKLAAKYLVGHEKDLLLKLKNSSKVFKLWSMRVLTENKSIESIPYLLNFITDIDENIANSAYDALKIITNIDTVAVFDQEKNDPETIAIFKKYYLKYRHSPDPR
ncbi:MAG: hypothetical protein V1874_13685 [Spirochaetota bacterium]